MMCNRFFIGAVCDVIFGRSSVNASESSKQQLHLHTDQIKTHKSVCVCLLCLLHWVKRIMFYIFYTSVTFDASTAEGQLGPIASQCETLQ